MEQPIAKSIPIAYYPAIAKRCRRLSNVALKPWDAMSTSVRIAEQSNTAITPVAIAIARSVRTVLLNNGYRSKVIYGYQQPTSC
jgi:hypothetical protein